MKRRSATSKSLLNDVANVSGVSVLAAKVNALDSEMLREMSDWLRAKLGSGVVALGAVFGDKPNLLVAVTRRPGGARPRRGQDRAAGGAAHRRRRRRTTEPRAGGRQGCESTSARRWRR